MDEVDDIIALAVCSTVLEVTDTLEHWVATASTSRKLGMIHSAPWWYVHAPHMSVASFHARFRLWPSALLRVVSLHTGKPQGKLCDSVWRDVLRMDCVRNLCHALEYLVHGT